MRVGFRDHVPLGRGLAGGHGAWLVCGLVLVLLLLGSWSCALPEEATFYLGGIQVREPDMDRWLRTLKEVGLNTVSVTVYARQGDWDSDDLRFDEQGDWIIPEIRAAKGLGLRVVLILRVAVDHALPRNRFLWHGMIMPRSQEQVDAWFRRYGEFVKRWARIAERAGVDVLGIGSELNALASTANIDRLPPLEEYYLNQEKQEKRHRQILASREDVDSQHLQAGWDDTYGSMTDYLKDQSAAHRAWALQVTRGGDLGHLNLRRELLSRHWRRLIAEVRESYNGRMTYAANFDQYQAVDFWDALDFVGINAYFPLRTGGERVESVADLETVFEDAWRQILGEALRFRGERGLGDRPILFTELGYTYRADSTIAPWAGSGFHLVGEGREDAEVVVWEDKPVEPRERALAVRALHETVQSLDPELLRGLLYWKLSTQERHREIEPFVLIVGADPVDPLLTELLRFVAEPSG